MHKINIYKEGRLFPHTSECKDDRDSVIYKCYRLVPFQVVRNSGVFPKNGAVIIQKYTDPHIC